MKTNRQLRPCGWYSDMIEATVYSSGLTSLLWAVATDHRSILLPVGYLAAAALSHAFARYSRKLEQETEDARPSDFLKAGFPFCSVFGDANAEVAACEFLRSLERDNDDLWPSESPLPIDTKISNVSSRWRMDMVAPKLQSAAMAREFSPGWRKVGLEQ